MSIVFYELHGLEERQVRAMLKPAIPSLTSAIMIGILGGGAVEYARSSFSDNEKLRKRRLVAAYDVRKLFISLHYALYSPTTDSLFASG